MMSQKFMKFLIWGFYIISELLQKYSWKKSGKAFFTVYILTLLYKPFKRQPHKMVKHTQSLKA